MRVLLDANVLFPSVLREILLDTADAGHYAPLWSARILEEWARATRRLPPGAEPVARAAAQAMRARWPDAEIAPDPDLEARLALPDPADRHVLAAAITGRADLIVTRNLGDFPGRAMARHGLRAEPPDAFLIGLLDQGANLVPLIAGVRTRSEALSGQPRALRPLLKRAGLPRLGKRLDPAG